MDSNWRHGGRVGEKCTTFGAEETVPDRSFSVDLGFQHGNIIGYANNGAHALRSQFFVTLGLNSLITNFKNLEELFKG